MSNNQPPAQPPLGQTAAYPDDYDPGLLFAIPRAEQRATLGITGTLPFFGTDIWNAYEMSWLNLRGKPQVGIATLQVPADSPNIVESKSMKLYMNSLNQVRMAGADAVQSLLQADLSAAFGAPVQVLLSTSESFGQILMGELEGLLLDRLDIEVDAYQPNPALLKANTEAPPVQEDVGIAFAQIKLPGHQPAGLGECANPLCRTCDRPSGFAELPDRISPASGISRALCRANFRGRFEGMQANQADGAGAIHPAGRD